MNTDLVPAFTRAPKLAARLVTVALAPRATVKPVKMALLPPKSNEGNGRGLKDVQQSSFYYNIQSLTSIMSNDKVDL
jgi:hypothetical protein